MTEFKEGDRVWMRNKRLIGVITKKCSGSIEYVVTRDGSGYGRRAHDLLPVIPGEEIYPHQFEPAPPILDRPRIDILDDEIRMYTPTSHEDLYRKLQKKVDELSRRKNR